MKVKLTKLLIAAGALAFTAFAGDAWAVEGNLSYFPGVTVGIPIGALPPPGFYFSDDNAIVNGGLVNDRGDQVKPPFNANVNAYINIPSVLWVPTWQPFQFIGATYAVAVIEPYIQESFNVNALGLPTTASGFFNTIISPINLSWNFAPFFFKTGLFVYLPDGSSSNGIANDYWTLEPDFAVSWLSDGWNLTAHVLVDFYTQHDNTKFLGIPTSYQNGNVFFLDWTAGKSFGKWSVGIGGNYTQQLNNDHLSNTLACAFFGLPGRSCDRPAVTIGGIPISGKGNVAQKVLVGPYIGYNFGPAEVNAKVGAAVRGENTFNATFWHLGVSFPF